MNENEITTPEQLQALPVGQWIVDANDTAWALFDTNVFARQRMWRSSEGTMYVAHDRIALPAGLADFNSTTACEHTNLTFEGWQCARCAIIINEPPPTELGPTSKGRQWFYQNAFGEWCGMSPDFDNIIALAEDVLARPHDTAARDRYAFELSALMEALTIAEAEDGLEFDRGTGLGLIISHMVARATR